MAIANNAVKTKCGELQAARAQEKHRLEMEVRELKNKATEHEKNVSDLINRRGVRLSTKSFRGLLIECLSNLYIHATSKEDIKKNAEQRKEEEQVQEAMLKQKQAGKQFTN